MRRAAGGECGVRALLDIGQPRFQVLVELGGGEVLDEQFPLPALDVVGARGLHDGRERDRDDEHRAAHTKHPQHRPVLVQRSLRGDGLTQPHRGGQVHRRRIGGVQGHQAVRDLFDTVRGALR